MLIIAKSARQWLIELYQRQGIQFFHSPQKYYHKSGSDSPVGTGLHCLNEAGVVGQLRAEN